MQHRATNTLRIFGIVLTATLTIFGCLFLGAVSRYKAHGGFAGIRDPIAAANYMFGATVVGFLGISFIAWLARGIYIGRTVPVSPAAQAGSSPPTFRSFLPAGRRSLVALVWCLGIQLAFSALVCIYTELQFREMSRELPKLYHSLELFAVWASILGVAPYAVVLYFVRHHPHRTVLAFALALPAVSILQTLIANVPFPKTYTSNPVSLALVAISLVLDIVTVVLAYKAAQRAGLKASASSLFTAFAVSILYSYSLHLILPALRRVLVS